MTDTLTKRTEHLIRYLHMENRHANGLCGKWHPGVDHHQWRAAGGEAEALDVERLLRMAAAIIEQGEGGPHWRAAVTRWQRQYDRLSRIEEEADHD